MNTTTKQYDDVAALLPWYVNGTLSEDETALVETALSDSEDLRNEVTALRQLADAVVAQEDNAAPVSPADMGWMRMKKQIASSRTTPLKTKAPLWQNFVAAAAVLVVVVQVGFVYQQGGAGNNIELLSGYELTEHPLQQLADYHVLQIQFNDNASVDEVNALLLEAEAVVISGPSAMGLYQITLPKSQSVANSLAVLQQHSAVSHVAEEVVE